MKTPVWQQIVFWIINVPLLLIGYGGVLATVESYATDAVTGTLPADFLFAFAGFIAVPSFCAVLVLQRRSLSPLRLFYGVEAPLLLICVARFFWLRELTVANGTMMMAGIVCAIAYLEELLHQETVRSRFWQWLQMIAHSLMLLCGVYLGIISLFYSIPFLAYSVIILFFALIIFYLFPVAVVGFALLSAPIGTAVVYFQAWQQKIKAFAAEYGWKRATLCTVGGIIAGISLFIGIQHQPQNQAFALLNEPPTDSNTRQELVYKSEAIRSGLLNAYLAQYRYPGTRQDPHHIRDFYRSIGVLDPVAQFVQDAHNTLLAPFFYGGSRTDSEKAARLYAQFFDTPIITAEQKAIKQAIGATFRRNEAKAGLLDINEEKVWLAQQQVTVEERGDWADIELYEVYDNQTYQQEEILYYFTLPESAVLTGVWLGENGNKAQRYAYTVSPRGAAQQVYNDEVRRRVDPALLEQVGPRNYRLRAFPIPVKGQGQMHLWLTYKVMQQEGGWALPQLQERRNIYWTEETQRVWQGKTITDQDQWLGEAIPAKAQPQVHQVNLAGYRITAQPGVQTPPIPPLRLAIAIDTSYSMRSHRQEVKQALQWLQKSGLTDNADIYVTASEGAQPQRIDDFRRFDPRQLTYYGLIQYKQMLRQFAQLQGDTAYDGVLLITDQGSYELSDDRNNVPELSAPLWMVHLGGLPRAYDDASVQAILTSGGGATTDAQEAVQRLTMHEDPSIISAAAGYTWRFQETDQKSATEDEFAPLAARQLVNQMIQGQPNLDAVHAIAKQYAIVTPYSSMIVLVNNRQREALKQAEADEDRFDREVEDQQLPPASDLSIQPVSAVPEPSEWMLLGIIAAVLIAINLGDGNDS